MEWAQVIVVLLFVCLTLFIVAALALIIILIKLTIQIRSLMKSAHEAADNLSQAVSVGSVTQIVTLIKAIKGKMGSYSRKRKGGKDE